MKAEVAWSKRLWSFIDIVFNVNKSQCQAQILTLTPLTAILVFLALNCQSLFIKDCRMEIESSSNFKLF